MQVATPHPQGASGQAKVVSASFGHLGWTADCPSAMSPGPTVSTFHFSSTGRPYPPPCRGRFVPLRTRSSRTVQDGSTYVWRFRLDFGCAPFHYGLPCAIRSVAFLRSTPAPPKTRPKRNRSSLTSAREQFRDSRRDAPDRLTQFGRMRRMIKLLKTAL